MHRRRIFVLTLLACASALGAQEPDSARARVRRDSIAKAASDSIALMKELGGALTPPEGASASTQRTQQGPTNVRLLPDVSVVGDLLGDLSPKGSTQDGGARLGIREVELAFQAVVDPYFRGDVFLGFNDSEGVAIEQAFLTTTSLPNQLEVKLGRFLMPFGKQNSTHRHDLHTIEYPHVIQSFFGPEGLKGTGVWGSRVFSPFGFFQEVQLTAIDRIGEHTDALTADEPVNKSLGGLGFSARVRNYVDLSEAANIELSFSGLTGKREQPLSDRLVSALVGSGSEVNAATARQSTLGADITYRWRPLQQGLYQSFIVQGEVMRQVNERHPGLPQVGTSCGASCASDYAGPTRDATGAYIFARLQTGQRSFIGSRFDYVQDAMTADGTLRAGSVYLEFFPSEFSKLVAGYEGVSTSGNSLGNRLLLQATFALGPHKPHPF